MSKKVNPPRNGFNWEYRLYLLLLVSNLILLTAADLLYDGQFNFWNDPFSYLGTAFSTTGLVNSASRIIYGVDMFISGLIMIWLASCYLRQKTGKYWWLKVALTLLACTGFVVAAFSPDDIRHRFHVIGSSALVVSLWILATVKLYEIRTQLKSYPYWAWQGLLQIPIFAYGGVFLADIEPLASILQKFALFSIVIVLIYSSDVYIRE